MYSPRYITLADFQRIDPIDRFSHRHRIPVHSANAIVFLCEAHGIAETLRIMYALTNKNKISYEQLRYLFKELKFKKLAIQLLSDGAYMHYTGVLERAEIAGLEVREIKGEKVIIGTFRDILKQPFSVRQKKVPRKKHISVM